MFDLTKLMIPFLLGIVEGITEFLPISSTGHIVLIEWFLHCINDSMQIFTVIVQSGAILSILVVFRERLYDMSLSCIFNIFDKKCCGINRFCVRHIFIGTVPATIFGTFFFDKIKLLLFEPIYVIYGLILGGLFLLIGEYYLYKSKMLMNCISNINNITYMQSFLIGCFQCLAFWPGFSRSGATIGAGLLVGLNRRVASEFSFLLAVPIILGSMVFTIYYYRIFIKIDDILILLIGFLIAFGVAMFVIRFLLRIIQKISLIPFVIYRFLLAIMIIYMQNLI